MKLNELLETFNIGENRWLIENLIPMGELVILYAQTNQYKTFLSLKIALEVATGSQELGVTESGCVYMISSDTKALKVRKALQTDGFTEEQIAELHSPIGLAIGTNHQTEIAISIIAELLQVRDQIQS